MFKDFFAETTTASMIRLTSFILVCLAVVIQLVACYIALNTHGIVINNVFIPADTNLLDTLNYSTFGILGLALGSKVIQKFGEKNNLDITTKP
jgi:hypothetical protein